MAGIYIHIPFCHRACTYCDFHFSTLLKYKPEVVRALVTEIDLQKDFFGSSHQINTLYFGGGTPSVLDEKELDAILDQLNKHFSFSKGFEFTLEANPEDMKDSLLHSWRNAGVNRLSIGIQSFRDKDLTWMKRGHSAGAGIASIKRAQDEGFSNLTIDLIYGLPGIALEEWKYNLKTFLSLNVSHLSAYSLTVEPKTLLAHYVEKNILTMPPDERFKDEFHLLVGMMNEAGFEHYEISNFAMPGFRSKHNSAYWMGEKYLGLGPSAHSYDLEKRSWNIANNHEYIRRIASGKLPAEGSEILTQTEKLNEYLMTSLRLLEGVDLEYLQHSFGFDLMKVNEKEIREWKEKGWMKNNIERLWLTTEGKMLANALTSQLFRE